MMNRRTFMMSGAAGAASFGAGSQLAQAQGIAQRDYYELRAYEVENEAQRDGLLAFLEKAAIPACNRLGISPVGVFLPEEDLSPVRVLLRHPSMDSVATFTQRLGADEAFMADGADFLSADTPNPAYKRVESSLLLAFEGIPKLGTPTQAEGRVFQLRIYESPSVMTGQKKIEMFNVAELEIFRKTGLTAVFFGEALVGPKMPNLTYMLAFDSMDDQKAAWQRFLNHPDWLALRGKPEYSDKKILCGITNLPLRAAPCSQI